MAAIPFLSFPPQNTPIGWGSHLKKFVLHHSYVFGSLLLLPWAPCVTPVLLCSLPPAPRAAEQSPRWLSRALNVVQVYTEIDIKLFFVFFLSIEQYPSMCRGGLLQNTGSHHPAGMETEDADMFGPNSLSLAMPLILQPAQLLLYLSLRSQKCQKVATWPSSACHGDF